jgi:hypothetical protein
MTKQDARQHRSGRYLFKARRLMMQMVDQWMWNAYCDCTPTRSGWVDLYRSIAFMGDEL